MAQKRPLYSGFLTEKQETHYDMTVEYAFELLCFKVLELLKFLGDSAMKGEVPLKHGLWVSKFFKTVKTLHKMEKHKRTSPKLLPLLSSLAQFLRQSVEADPDGDKFRSTERK